MKGIPDCPVPRRADQAYPLSERDTKGLNFGVDGGEDCDTISRSQKEF